MLKLKRLAAFGAATAITAGGVLMATPAQATVPRPVVDPQNSIQRTVNLRAGEACEFPVRISVRIRDVDRDRNRNRVVVDADGIRGRVTNLRNGRTFTYSGDAHYVRNLRTGVLRGEGDQLLRTRANRSRNPRFVNRLFFTEDPTRGLLLGGQLPVLPRERLLRAGDLENVCGDIRGRRVVRPVR